MIEVFERFRKLTGNRFKIMTHPESERPYPIGSSALPDLRTYASKLSADDGFLLSATDEENLRSSPLYGANLWRMRLYMNDAPKAAKRRYSFVQLYYSWEWWLEEKEPWEEFVQYSIEKLNAFVVYSGFAVVNPVEPGTRADAAVWERALTPYFYGLDIDNPIGQNELGYGIRTPTWGFFLSDALRDCLEYSREQVMDVLADPRIKITVLASGLWIELGDAPSLFPVSAGVPELAVLLNRLIKPVRDDEMSVLGFAEWDDDPNERFNKSDSARWMGRFDENSDWPSRDLRRAQIRRIGTHGSK